MDQMKEKDMNLQELRSDLNQQKSMVNDLRKDRDILSADNESLNRKMELLVRKILTFAIVNLNEKEQNQEKLKDELDQKRKEYFSKLDTIVRDSLLFSSPFIQDQNKFSLSEKFDEQTDKLRAAMEKNLTLDIRVKEKDHQINSLQREVNSVDFLYSLFKIFQIDINSKK